MNGRCGLMRVHMTQRQQSILKDLVAIARTFHYRAHDPYSVSYFGLPRRGPLKSPTDFKACPLTEDLPSSSVKPTCTSSRSDFLR